MWKLLSSSPLPPDQDESSVIEISNLTPVTVYSIRITAHTKGSLSTMAEYEVRVGFGDSLDSLDDSNSIIDSSTMLNINQSGYIGRMVDFSTRLMFDTSTIISLISSLIVLLIGFIAVVCLIAYKKKLNHKLYTRHTTYSSSSSINAASSGNHHHSHHVAGQSHHLPSHLTPVSNVSTANFKANSTSSQLTSGLMKTSNGRIINSSVISAIQKQKLPPIPVNNTNASANTSECISLSTSEIKSTPPTPGLVNLLNQQAAAAAAAAAAGFNSSSTASNTPYNMKSKNFSSSSNNSSSNQSNNLIGAVGIRSRLPAVNIPRKQLEQLENDIYNEYDEIAPYATFSRVTALSNSSDDITEEFKTFTVRIGEPAYCFKVRSAFIYSFLFFPLSRAPFTYRLIFDKCNRVTRAIECDEKKVHSLSHARPRDHFFSLPLPFHSVLLSTVIAIVNICLHSYSRFFLFFVSVSRLCQYFHKNLLDAFAHSYPSSSPFSFCSLHIFFFFGLLRALSLYIHRLFPLESTLRKSKHIRLYTF